MHPPTTIESVRLRQVNLPPKVVRTDAIQSFVTQETLLLTLRCSDGMEGTGYAYTIGTGGSSVLALLRDHLAPRLIGRNPVHVEAIWKDLFFHTHATAVGAITTIHVAVGESMYQLAQFREYLEQGACSIVQPDVARIGGITPWIKVAHLAEGFDVPVCPHFLMELHVSLCAAVPNAAWVEYIPQLDDVTTSRIRVENGYAYPPDTPGLGIEWDWAAITRRQLADATVK